MGLVLAVLVAAALLAAARGGRLSRLSARRWSGGWLLAVALGAELAAAAAGRLPGRWTVGPADLALAVAALAAAAFLARNLRAPGLPLAAAGLLLNAVVVVANGGMPVSAAAAARAGARPALDGWHVAAGPGTRLRLLGDVVPVALPGAGEVASPGDLLVAAGLGLFVVTAAGTRRRRTAAGRARPAPRAALADWAAPAVAPDGKGTRWPSEPASAAPGPGARRTTASARTPEPRGRPVAGQRGRSPARTVRGGPPTGPGTPPA